MPWVPVPGTAAKLLRLPPSTTMSPRAKVVLASLRVKVMVSVVVSVPVPLRVMAMVGGKVSTTMVLVVMVTVLLASVPSALALPAWSLNLADSTWMVLGTRLLARGVKTAV